MFLSVVNLKAAVCYYSSSWVDIPLHGLVLHVKVCNWSVYMTNADRCSNLSAVILFLNIWITTS